MPRAYLGLVSRELCDRIITKYGSLFGGVSPDIYSAALISTESKKTFQVDYPLVLPGSSGASTSGLSAKGAHKGTLRDNPHIGAFKNLNWDEIIPEFYSVQTVWSYSLVAALYKINNPLLIPNYESLYAQCFIYHKSFSIEVNSSISHLSKNKSKFIIIPKIVFNIIKHIFRFLLKASNRFIFAKLNNKTAMHKSLNNIDEAYEKLKQLVDKEPVKHFFAKHT